MIFIAKIANIALRAPRLSADLANCWGKTAGQLVARHCFTDSYCLGQTPRQNCFTKFGDSGDSRPPWQNSNIAATTSNPRTRMGRRISEGLETTVGKSVGEPLRYPLLAKQISSPTRPRWVRTCTSPDSLPQRVGTPVDAEICACCGYT